MEEDKNWDEWELDSLRTKTIAQFCLLSGATLETAMVALLAYKALPEDYTQDRFFKTVIRSITV